MQERCASEQDSCQVARGVFMSLISPEPPVLIGAVTGASKTINTRILVQDNGFRKPWFAGSCCLCGLFGPCVSPYLMLEDGDNSAKRRPLCP